MLKEYRRSTRSRWLGKNGDDRLMHLIDWSHPWLDRVAAFPNDAKLAVIEFGAVIEELVIRPREPGPAQPI
jgi:hypothetical protein